ncbi:MAG: VanZ family protein [Vicingaceae bacterium]|nr:VanZ family protein [Vicingaceae bacterium]
MTIRLFKYYIPAIVWLVIITVISGFPGNHVPKLPVWQFDKLVHSVIYFVLSICLLYGFHSQYKAENTRLRTAVIIIIFGVFYGGFMEILQHYIFINRSGNWYDFIANAIGSVLGVFIYPFVIKLLPINRC